MLGEPRGLRREMVDIQTGAVEPGTMPGPVFTLTSLPSFLPGIIWLPAHWLTNSLIHTRLCETDSSLVKVR